MSRPFRFKQFVIEQANAPFKVGTDGVLLGAWTEAVEPEAILDIGTGTGLVALMLAQRYSQAYIDAVEINPIAAAGARHNFSSSPWAGRMNLNETSLLDFKPSMRYDLIVCNPPFFEESTPKADAGENQARHTISLNFRDVLIWAAQHLSTSGKVALIIPYVNSKDALSVAGSQGLYVRRTLKMIPNPGAEVKRVLIEWTRDETDPQESELVLEIDRHHYSEEARSLLKDFYLYL